MILTIFSLAFRLPVKNYRFVSAEFLNREISWIDFNLRVLHEALDERVPLLERVRFLSICSSNLDEFFMKRVGGIKRQQLARVFTTSPTGPSPGEQLASIRKAVLPLLSKQGSCYQEQLRPALSAHGIELLNWEALSTVERGRANTYFETNVFAVLTPLAVDPAHPFPFISNLSTSLGVTLRSPRKEERQFARIKIPDVLPYWIRVDSEHSEERYRFVRLVDIIQHNLFRLFPQMIITGSMLFRITRNADIEREEEDVEDLLEMIEEEVRQRRFAHAVRLEHLPNPDPWVLELLLDELELSTDDVYEVSGEVDFTKLKDICELNIPALRYEPWVPVVPAALSHLETTMFDLIRERDLLVHHPYESFMASVVRFVEDAVNDPKVLAIKMTVYRTGPASPFIPLLIRAARAGKQVVCLVELKARFDEEQNIQWAEALEDAGVHVMYGIVGLKTHAKTIVVVRNEGDRLRSYAHIGTGNYQAQTANIYTDLSLFTAKQQYTDDLLELFLYLTGRSLKPQFKSLLIAPFNLRERFLELIERELSHHQRGRPAEIIAKMNSLEDIEICHALRRAANHGVSIKLIVRGLCILRPEGEGEGHLRIISVVGRLLEHSRIFYFRNGAQNQSAGEFFIGSADWMTRNLLGRIEIVAPIEEATLKEECWTILETMLADHRQSWEMRADGKYIQKKPRNAEDLGTHLLLMNEAKGKAYPPMLLKE